MAIKEASLDLLVFHPSLIVSNPPSSLRGSPPVGQKYAEFHLENSLNNSTVDRNLNLNRPSGLWIIFIAFLVSFIRLR